MSYINIDLQIGEPLNLCSAVVVSLDEDYHRRDLSQNKNEYWFMSSYGPSLKINKESKVGKTINEMIIKEDSSSKIHNYLESITLSLLDYEWINAIIIGAKKEGIRIGRNQIKDSFKDLLKRE